MFVTIKSHFKDTFSAVWLLQTFQKILLSQEFPSNATYMWVECQIVEICWDKSIFWNVCNNRIPFYKHFFRVLVGTNIPKNTFVPRIRSLEHIELNVPSDDLYMWGKVFFFGKVVHTKNIKYYRNTRHIKHYTFLFISTFPCMLRE